MVIAGLSLLTTVLVSLLGKGLLTGFVGIRKIPSIHTETNTVIEEGVVLQVLDCVDEIPGDPPGFADTELRSRSLEAYRFESGNMVPEDGHELMDFSAPPFQAI